MIAAVRGFLLPFQGLRLILSPGLRRYVLIPLLVNLLIFGALAYFGATYFEHFMNRWLPTQSWLEFVRWILWLLFAAVYALALFYGFTAIANLIGSPFNAMLAAKVEEKLTGTRPADADESLLKAVGPALLGEIGKLGYLVSRAAPLLILFLIPGLNIVVSVAWLLFGFWFLTIEYADYPMGNHALKAREQRARLRRNRLQSLAFGAGVTVIMLIPVLQFAAMPAAVAAATRLWVDDLKAT
ncbi:MAG: sulfate transporter CysZ [Gammaproteobacteria bacterium]|nr:sulfate transporter CysZ [Gammaproteobacteria bacterium]MCB1922818.1 sulfate transporter CysZ [Gammaproteobacteria bacterium]